MSMLLNSTSTIGTLRNLGNTSNLLNKSLERLSSGYKINHASDGAANLLVSENLQSQINGLGVATTNSQQGLSMLQTADSALQQINNHLQNIREIAVAASNGTTSTAQFAAYQADVVAESAAIDSIGSNTKYGSQVLLDGSLSGAAFNLQIGANSSDTLDISSAFASAKTGAAGIGTISGTLASTANATTILGQVDTALDSVASKLSTLGQFEDTLQDQMNYLSIAKENMSASQSAIRDTDVASETSNVARLQILQQAGAYALSTSNASSSIALRLLQ